MPRQQAETDPAPRTASSRRTGRRPNRKTGRDRLAHPNGDAPVPARSLSLETQSADPAAAPDDTFQQRRMGGIEKVVFAKGRVNQALHFRESRRGSDSRRNHAPSTDTL